MAAMNPVQIASGLSILRIAIHRIKGADAQGAIASDSQIRKTTIRDEGRARNIKFFVEIVAQRREMARTDPRLAVLKGLLQSNKET